MGWIKNIIKAQHRKHKGLDWMAIAEAKIKSEIKFKLFGESEEKPNTMHEEYGDGSDHRCCDECGLCVDCKDCRCKEESNRPKHLKFRQNSNSTHKSNCPREQLAKDIIKTIKAREHKGDIGTLTRIYSYCGKQINSQGERARNRKVDKTSNEVCYNASESISNKRDIGNPDTSPEQDVLPEIAKNIRCVDKGEYKQDYESQLKKRIDKIKKKLVYILGEDGSFVLKTAYKEVFHGVSQEVSIPKQNEPFYRCGHKGKPIFLDDNILSITAFLEWNESDGREGNKSQCWECWCKPEEQDESISGDDWCKCENTRKVHTKYGCQLCSCKKFVLQDKGVPK